MDPLTMSAGSQFALTALTGGLAAGAQVYSAASQAEAMQAEAKAGQQKAAIEGQWNERRALEERVSAQRAAGEEQRKAALAQSRLGAIAGASGAGSSDPSVMNLFEGIEKEGDQNAANVTAAGDQRAAGLQYQTALDRWSADTNARIKSAGAKSTLIGGYLGAASQAGQFAVSRMGARYGGSPMASSGSTGYGSGGWSTTVTRG